MSKNQVFLNPDSIIEVRVVGDQNTGSVELMGRDINILIMQLKAAGKPVLILDNLLEMGNVDGPGRKLVVSLGKHLQYDKLAMVGKGGILRIGTNLMFRAMGRGDKIRLFTDQEAAVQWLQA